MSITRDDLADVPDNWTLERYTEGDSWSDPDYAEWRYTPRLELVVRVVRRTTNATPAYVTEREHRLHTKEFATHTPGFAAHVTLAHRLIHGVNGITTSELARRLNINGTAGHALANRAATFEDVIDIYHDANGEITYLDGVGPKASAALEAAIEEGVLTAAPIEVARNLRESTDKTAVYQLTPTLENGTRAWRVRKEWRHPDGRRLSRVFLPVEQAKGAVYSSFETAAERAREFAYDRACSRDAVATNSVTRPGVDSVSKPSSPDSGSTTSVYK